MNVEITPLPNLNTVVETTLTNQPIFGLEESDEENLEKETEESNNDIGTIFISLKITRNKLCLKKQTLVFKIDSIN